MKRRPSKSPASTKQKKTSLKSPLRQMTMTQLFDPVESPSVRTNRSTLVKNEPNTPSDDTSMFIPESLVGLAQPLASASDQDDDQVRENHDISMDSCEYFFRFSRISLI